MPQRDVGLDNEGEQSVRHERWGFDFGLEKNEAIACMAGALYARFVYSEGQQIVWHIRPKFCPTLYCHFWTEPERAVKSREAA